MFLVGTLLRFGFVTVWMFHLVACMGGCIGSDAKNKLTKTKESTPCDVSEPCMEEGIEKNSRCEVSNNVVRVSSINTLNPTLDSHATWNTSQGSINHGFLLWNEIRQQWIGHKRKSKQTIQNREPRLSVGTIEVGVSSVSAVGDSTGAGVSASVAEDDDVDIDSLLDLDFMATTTASVSTPLEMAGTTSAEDKEDSDESGDEDDEAGGEGAGDSDSEDTPDDEFESVCLGKRLVKRKRKRSGVECEEIIDLSFIPEFDIFPPPRTSASATTTAYVATAVQSISSHVGRRKRARFLFQRRSELSTATTTVTSVAAVAVPSLTRSRAVPTRSTVAPLTTSVAQAPIFTSASAGPSIIRADLSIHTVSVVEQLSTLNSVVLRLMERNLEQERKKQGAGVDDCLAHKAG
ncbi:hypothetical protein R6Q57_002129 [Mikania cordata]